MKVKTDLLSWLRVESARRGVFLYELVEELVSRSMVGRKPWLGAEVVSDRQMRFPVVRG